MAEAFELTDRAPAGVLGIAFGDDLGSLLPQTPPGECHHSHHAGPCTIRASRSSGGERHRYAARNMPRFSVLLPTHNGGDLLDPCIRSVLDQGFDDIELIVADNANTDRTREVLAGHKHDPRLRVVRHDELLSVTDNWASTLEMARGEYVLMIGDDDLLRRGYFDTVQSELKRYGDPDCLTYNGIRYVAPAIIDGRFGSLWAEPYYAFEPDLPSDGPLSSQARTQIVLDLYRLRFRFPLTLQVTVFARRGLQRLPRGAFQSPFPDHYALGGLLLTADTWALSSVRPIVVGVSSKSFGQYFFRAQDGAGLRYLGVDGRFDGSLPGNEVLNTQVAWLEEMRRDFPELAGVRLDRGAYVLRQVWTWVRAVHSGLLAPRELGRQLALLRPRDVRAAAATLAGRDTLRDARDAVASTRRGGGRASRLRDDLHALPDIQDIVTFASWLDTRGSAGVRAPAR